MSQRVAHLLVELVAEAGTLDVDRRALLERYALRHPEAARPYYARNATASSGSYARRVVQRALTQLERAGLIQRLPRDDRVGRPERVRVLRPVDLRAVARGDATVEGERVVGAVERTDAQR